MIKLVQKWEDIDSKTVAPSTAVNTGDALSYSAGVLVPSTPGDAIVGFSLAAIAATDPDYASTVKKLSYQKAGPALTYKFNIPVTAGTAIATMVGSIYDLDTAGSLDVSAGGTQLKVETFISATEVEVSVALVA